MRERSIERGAGKQPRFGLSATGISARSLSSQAGGARPSRLKASRHIPRPQPSPHGVPWGAQEQPFKDDVTNERSGSPLDGASSPLAESQRPRKGVAPSVACRTSLVDPEGPARPRRRVCRARSAGPSRKHANTKLAGSACRCSCVPPPCGRSRPGSKGSHGQVRCRAGAQRGEQQRNETGPPREGGDQAAAEAGSLSRAQRRCGGEIARAACFGCGGQEGARTAASTPSVPFMSMWGHAVPVLRCRA